jgi:hypothetical protein
MLACIGTLVAFRTLTEATITILVLVNWKFRHRRLEHLLYEKYFAFVVEA